MLKFIVLLFKSLPNEAHYKFFDKVTKEIAKAGSAVQIALGMLIAELNDWFEKEDACIAWVRKSALKSLIKDANKHLDRSIVGMSAKVRSQMYSSTASVATAAGNIYIMLKSYGRVTTKPYLQEIGAVNAIIAHLEGDLATDAVAVGIEEWIAEIKDAVEKLDNLIEQRGTKTLDKPEMTFPQVRKGIEKVWHQIVTLVNSGSALNVSPDFAALINALNPEIMYLNSEFHRAKHSITTAVIAEIAQQIYSGEPCTPVPEVSYTTTTGVIKLALGKDFNITYKNNIEPGNAQCTVHGKGAYKGKKTVTFIIDGTPNVVKAEKKTVVKQSKEVKTEENPVENAAKEVKTTENNASESAK
jgi:hypothetical protein